MYSLKQFGFRIQPSVWFRSSSRTVGVYSVVSAQFCDPDLLVNTGGQYPLCLVDEILYFYFLSFCAKFNLVVWKIRH